MINILNYHSYVNENELPDNKSTVPHWVIDGIVFIRGLEINGITRLYAFKVNKVYKGSGGDHFKADLKMQPYRIAKSGDNYVQRSVEPSPAFNKKNIGISTSAISLNAKTGKTPIWRDTIKETNFAKVLKENKSVLDSWTDITY
jgi:hypothetical protein